MNSKMKSPVIYAKVEKMIEQASLFLKEFKKEEITNTNIAGSNPTPLSITSRYKEVAYLASLISSRPHKGPQVRILLPQHD